MWVWVAVQTMSGRGTETVDERVDGSENVPGLVRRSFHGEPDGSSSPDI